jgi:DNA ligase-1
MNTTQQEIGMNREMTRDQVFFTNYDFAHLEGMVRDLRATSSTNDKATIIEDYCGRNTEVSNFLKKILVYTYHPLWNYGVTSTNLNKKSHLRGVLYSDFFELLDDLKNRKLTGHDAIGAVNSFIDDLDENFRDIVYCIIDKDLKTRAGDKIINKAVPDLIPEFSVALADNYKGGIEWTEKGWYVSRKLDGVRCIAVVDSVGNTTFYSRTGKVFDTLRVVADGISALGISNVVFDGELCLLDEDGNEDFQGIMKELRKKDHTIQNPSYKIFDCLSHSEFDTGKSIRNFANRYENLRAIMQDNNCPCLSVLGQTLVTDDDVFEEWTRKANSYGWEGLILRKNTTYKGKRSKDLLKVKQFFDAEYGVVDVEMGPFRYVKDGAECEEEMMSAVYIEHKGYSVKVGSGFTIEQRQHFYKNPQDIVGKEITVQYFEETKNQDGGISLRFPTLKHIYGKDGRKV